MENSNYVSVEESAKSQHTEISPDSRESYKRFVEESLGLSELQFLDRFRDHYAGQMGNCSAQERKLLGEFGRHPIPMNQGELREKLRLRNYGHATALVSRLRNKGFLSNVSDNPVLVDIADARLLQYLVVTQNSAWREGRRSGEIAGEANAVSEFIHRFRVRLQGTCAS